MSTEHPSPLKTKCRARGPELGGGFGRVECTRPVGHAGNHVNDREYFRHEWAQTPEVAGDDRTPYARAMTELLSEMEASLAWFVKMAGTSPMHPKVAEAARLLAKLDEARAKAGG